MNNNKKCLYNHRYLDRCYRYLVDEQAARITTDISSPASHVIPGNFFLLLLAYIFTKTSDVLADTKTTLPWLLGYLGAPIFFTGILVPIREAGSLLPQAAMLHLVQRQTIRKRAWAIGGIIQAGALLGIASSAYLFTGISAGISIIMCLTIFSLARSLCSLSSKDVIGKTIPKTRRGRLSGYSASLAGMAAIVVSLILALLDIDGLINYVVLLIVAAICWLVASGIYIHLRI